MEISEGFYAIIWNIIGGATVALFIYFGQLFVRKIRRYRFRKVFGKDVEQDFDIIYPVHESNKDTIYEKPKSKVARTTRGVWKQEYIVTPSGPRVVNYISSLIGDICKASPNIRSDIEADADMDISFLSIGGITNYKTVDLLNNERNVFITFGPGSETIQSKISGKPIVKAEAEVDYGFIIKIHPSNNHKRTWICCSGMGSWATSGAAWWLAHNWKYISRKAGSKPFACLIKTRVGSDESTECIKLFLDQQGVEIAARSQHIGNVAQYNSV